MIELVDQAEIVRLRAAEELPDDDVDRAAVFDFVTFRVTLLSLQGMCLDPYSSADLARALDRVAMRLPHSSLEQGEPRATIVMYSNVRRTSEISVDVKFVRRSFDEGVVEKKAEANIDAAFANAILPAMPKGKWAETRIVIARIQWQAKIRT